MLRVGIWHLLRTATLLGCISLCAYAQTELQPAQQIHLPVPSARGSYDHFPYSGMDSREHFSMRVAPDQSVLVLDSDAGGNWPLVRLRKWWTDTPARATIDIPGWTDRKST